MTSITTHTLRTKMRAAIHKLPLMMGCDQLELQIDDYLAGEMTRKERLLFQLHLKVCRDCRAYLLGYERTIAATAVLFDVPYTELGMGEVSKTLVDRIIADNAAPRQTD